MDAFRRPLSDGFDEPTGANGFVGVVGGSVEYPNQPALVCRAALRTGSANARALVGAPIHPVVAGNAPNALVSRYEGDRFTDSSVDYVERLAEDADALVIGPGFGDPEPSAIRNAIDAVDVPVVVDAVAIERGLDANLSNAILTPDGSEVRSILDAYDSLEACASETGAVVVETGDVDEIFADGEVIRNDTGTPSLTTCGTGDTLTGIVASLLGRGASRRDAAELGAWTLGEAGELATADHGVGVVATDVIDRIPDVVR